MPQRNSSIQRTLFRLVLLSLAGHLLGVFDRGARRITARPWDEWDEKRVAATPDEQEPVTGATSRPQRRRLATTLVFSTLFFAGAALSAGAGDQVRGLLESDSTTAAVTTDTTTTSDPAPPDPSTTTDSSTDPTTTDSGAAPPPPPADSGAPAAPAPPASAGEAPAPPAPAEQAPPPDSGSQPATGSPDEQNLPDVSASADSSTPVHAASADATSVSAHQPVRRARGTRKRAKAPALDPEVQGVPGVTVWLNRALPDPTPDALRLRPSFARQLAATSKRTGTDWALVLAVLRAKGSLGSVPASPRALSGVARRLSGFGGSHSAWAAAISFSGQTLFADRVAALTHYYRAVGLRALVTGLQAAKESLTARVLNDRRVSIYAGGRDDLVRGRVNVRVVVLIEYLADTFGQVTVSCLVTGHRLFARPGVVSAHIYGLAADISVVGGVTVAGHQQPGGPTEQAVRSILLLPSELQPRQVISLLGLGGPSFPLANHWDHIHVGY